MHWLALHARSTGQRWGGWGAMLALLGLHWGQATDPLDCAARPRSSAKMGGSVALALLGAVHLAWFA
jgi:hypothetical protein